MVCLTGGPTLLGEVMLEISMAGPDSRRITAAKGVGGHMVSWWGSSSENGQATSGHCGGLELGHCWVIREKSLAGDPGPGGSGKKLEMYFEKSAVHWPSRKYHCCWLLS